MRPGNAVSFSGSSYISLGDSNTGNPPERWLEKATVATSVTTVLDEPN